MNRLAEGTHFRKPWWFRLFTVTAVVVASSCFFISTSYAGTAPPGTTVGWGPDGAGELSGPATLTGVKDVSLGAAHSLALKEDGTVYAWGWNRWGEGAVPEGLKDVKAISAGNWHNLALRNDGTVVAWGLNDWGQGSVPDGLSNVVAISAGHSHNLALKADGTLVAWGVPGAGTAPAGLSNIKAISAGVWHSLAVKNDGSVVTWGLSAYGLSDIPASATRVVAVAGGNYHSAALKDDGTVVAWGYNVDGESTVPAGLTNVKAIEAGYFHTLALKTDGTVVAWGANSLGAINVPPTLQNAVAISAGNHESIAVLGEHSPPPDDPGDTIAPVLDVPRDTNAPATSIFGATVRYTVVATDDTDPSPQVSCVNAAGVSYPIGTGVTALFPLGTTKITCRAQDLAGNIATGAFTVRVTYSWGGIRPPIKPDGTSVFKAGSTIPVKFTLSGLNTTKSSVQATMWYAPDVGGKPGAWSKGLTKSPGAIGNQFRYAGEQYIFDWATSGLKPGVYWLKIDLSDGNPQLIRLSLNGSHPKLAVM